MKKNLLPTALIYLDRGWSVIPVGADKRPLVIWKEFQSRRATPEELVAWWTTNPDAQVGIVTGQISDLTVIDVEADGDFNLIKDETFEVETGGKGRHYYFKYEKEFRNAVRIFPSVDVRSEGGYVVGPGSVTSKGAYTVLKDVDVANMSDTTRKAFLASKKKEIPWYVTSGPSLYPRVTESGVDYAGFGEGGRNDAMTKFAGSLHAKLHPSLWTSIGWQMFESGNQKNSPPLSQYELRTIWNSVGSIELRRNPTGRDYSTSGSQEKTWGPDPEKREVDEAHRYEDSLSSDDEPAPELDPKETLHASDVAAAQVIDSDHTYPLDMPPFDEALLGGFSAGEVIVVAGQSGHGKTTLIQDWSVTLSSGGQSQHDKLPSLWFSYEVLARPLWQKFQGMGASIDTPIYMPRFNETGEVEWVIDVIEGAIKKWGIKIVCIDHLGFLRAPRGNYSNAADALTNTVRALKRLAVKRGLIILLPVHIRKTNSKTPDLNDIRDSLGIAQEADTVFFIGREKDESGLQTNQAKLWLVKNRKTGISVNALFDFQFGRYYYNAGD
ncbi:MAG: bifunctional DNA primase/polymerase, partial [Candidatus Colwellbacteria bacterium]|nr:bifunctional DNA primase/polymerase [Candidatus Colwellbacteria bacterium]